jgi:hypothetical protein
LSEVPAAGDDDEIDGNAGDDQIVGDTEDDDDAGSGDEPAVVVPPWMDPGVLGFPWGDEILGDVEGELVGDPAEAAQLLDDSWPRQRWSALEILLAILGGMLAGATIAMAVKLVLARAVAGEALSFPGDKALQGWGRPADPAEAAKRLSDAEKKGLLEKARERNRSMIERRRAQRRARLLGTLFSDAPGSVVVSQPVDVMVEGRPVAVLQPGQPYTRIGFTPDGQTVVQWGPDTYDVGIVPTEALQTLPPPPPP